MATVEYDVRVRSKHDSITNWKTNDPVLLEGEQVFVITTDGSIHTKVGDGTSKFSELPYALPPIYVGSGDMPEGYSFQLDPNGGTTNVMDERVTALEESVAQILLTISNSGGGN